MQSISLWSASLDCCSTKPNIRFVYATKHAPARATHTHAVHSLTYAPHVKWNDHRCTFANPIHCASEFDCRSRTDA